MFDAVPVRGEPPIVKEDLPFGAMQQFIIHLENLLILLARRCRRTKRPVARVRRERRQYVLVEDARAYFAANLTRELKVDEVCAALAAPAPQLQQAFPRAAAPHRDGGIFRHAHRICGPTAGARCLPGEVAAQMGYCSGADFSQRFRAATGHTPSAYRRIQQKAARPRQNRQQKANRNQKHLLQKARRKSKIQSKDR